MIAGRHEQLGPYEVQDQELAFVQHSAEATRIAVLNRYTSLGIPVTEVVG